MIRIDMSEYMEKHTVGGSSARRRATSATRRRATQRSGAAQAVFVILFDEIEKAHHDVFNVLLQVLDDGRLTDGQGRTVDFKNTIVIMTSNLGSPIIQEYFMDGHTDKAAHQAMEDKVLAELKKHFRPEFLNRVDDVIIFQSLDESELARIVDIQLGGWNSDSHSKISRSTWTTCEEAARQRRLRPQFGARPLKRAIQEHLLDPLATKLLAGEFKPGDKIKVTAKDDN